MANPLVQQINVELESLQKELSQFKSTVEYLNSAKTRVNEAVQSVNHSEDHFNIKVSELKGTYDSIIGLSDEITKLIIKLDGVNFPERLDSIENTVKETLTNLNDSRDEALDELKNASNEIRNVDFEGKFKGLDSQINSSVEASDKLSQYISKLKLGEKFEKLQKSTEKQLDQSFTKIEKNTNQISNKAVRSIDELNIPVRMDKLDANISGILSAIQNVQTRIESVERNMGEKLKESGDKQVNILNSLLKKHQTNSYVTWSLIVLSAAAITILILFKLK